MLRQLRENKLGRVTPRRSKECGHSLGRTRLERLSRVPLPLFLPTPRSLSVFSSLPTTVHSVATATYTTIMTQLDQLDETGTSPVPFSQPATFNLPNPLVFPAYRSPGSRFPRLTCSSDPSRRLTETVALPKKCPSSPLFVTAAKPTSTANSDRAAAALDTSEHGLKTHIQSVGDQSCREIMPAASRRVSLKTSRSWTPPWRLTLFRNRCRVSGEPRWVRFTRRSRPKIAARDS
jgi:hypothetical protein